MNLEAGQRWDGVKGQMEERRSIWPWLPTWLAYGAERMDSVFPPWGFVPRGGNDELGMCWLWGMPGATQLSKRLGPSTRNMALAQRLEGKAWWTTANQELISLALKKKKKSATKTFHFHFSLYNMKTRQIHQVDLGGGRINTVRAPRDEPSVVIYDVPSQVWAWLLAALRKPTVYSLSKQRGASWRELCIEKGHIIMSWTKMAFLTMIS